MAQVPSRESPAGAPGEEQLRLHLQGLQHQVERSSAWVRRLIVLAGVLIVMLAALLIFLRAHYVMQYAPVDGIHFTANADTRNAAEISYVPQATGKVEFLRQAAHQTETLIEHVESPGTKKTFIWTGAEGEAYTLTARYRQGWSVVEKKWSPAK
jgi:hypothetical protein